MSLPRRRQTANDRFKASFGQWLGGSFMLAVVLHFGFLEFFPSLTAAVVRPERPEPPIVLPDLPELPPPPKPIKRPAVPKVVADDLNEEPLPVTTLEGNPVPDLPTPPAAVAGTGDSRFVAFTVRPEIKDRTRAVRIVEAHYPRLLKSAGIGGSVTVRALIDTTGQVRDVMLAAGSGNPALDAAALVAVREFEFTPALNRDKKVSVWVQQIIYFEVR